MTRKLFTVSLVVIGLILLCFSFAVNDNVGATEGDYIDSWSQTAPNALSHGITTDGTNIWTSDSGVDLVYKYDMVGGYIDSWPLTALNDYPFSIATDGTNIWVVDSTDDDVYKYDMAGNYLGVWPLTGANTEPYGMATDGTNIWVVDYTTDDVYKYNMVGTYDTSWSLTVANDYPYGLATDGTNIWVVDKTDLTVYKYDMVGNYINSWPLTGANSYPLGLTTDGINIWACDVNDDVYKYEGPVVPNNPPIQSGESPTNESVDIGLIPDLYVMCIDNDNDKMNATWWSNSSGDWVQFASNWTSFANNTNVTQSFVNATDFSTTYYWSLNLTDGTDWDNETYHFTTVANNVPTLSNENPADNLGDVAISFAFVCVTIEDIETTFNWTIQGEYITNTGANGVSNGSKCAYTITPLPLFTDIIWFVNVTDGTDWTNATYNFTTAANAVPVQSGESPTDGSVEVTLNSSVYVLCADADNDYMNASWYSNSSGNWVWFGSNSTFLDANITQPNNNFSAYGTTYYWSLNLTDGIDWCNETYSFTTVVYIPYYTKAELDAMLLDYYTQSESDNTFLSALFGLEGMTFLVMLWVLMFWMWFKSESEDMTYLIAIIFIPYTIFFTWFVLPEYITHWMGTAMFVCIALIVGVYTLDMYRTREKK